MDKDVEGKLGRFCDRYARAASEIERLRPVGLQTNKAHRRVEQRVARILEGLGRDCSSSTKAMIRLAYVRALRQHLSEARLGPDQEKEIEFLAGRLNSRLAALDREVFMAFRRHLSHLITAQTMRRIGAGEHIASIIEQTEASVPLEQRARTCATYILSMAETAGNLAGTAPGNYDGVPDVH